MQTLHFQCCYLCNRHKFRELKDTQQEACAVRRTFIGLFSVWTFSMGDELYFLMKLTNHGGLKSVKMCNFFLLSKRKFFQKVLVLNFEVLIIQQLVNIFIALLLFVAPCASGPSVQHDVGDKDLKNNLCSLPHILMLEKP